MCGGRFNHGVLFPWGQNTEENRLGKLRSGIIDPNTKFTYNGSDFKVFAQNLLKNGQNGEIKYNQDCNYFINCQKTTNKCYITNKEQF
jgi:hypothetical protein